MSFFKRFINRLDDAFVNALERARTAIENFHPFAQRPQDPGNIIDYPERRIEPPVDEDGLTAYDRAVLEMRNRPERPENILEEEDEEESEDSSELGSYSIEEDEEDEYEEDEDEDEDLELLEHKRRFDFDQFILQHIDDLISGEYDYLTFIVDELLENDMDMYDFLKLIKDNYGNRHKFVIEVQGVYYTLNERTYKRLLALFKDQISIRDKESDQIYELIRKGAKRFSIMLTKNVAIYKNKEGAFWPYINKTVYDLTRYGIYQTINTENDRDNCLIYALKQGGLPEEKLMVARMMCGARFVSRVDVKKMCNELGIFIGITDYKDDDIEFTKGVITKNGDENSEYRFEVCLFKKHYFIKDKKTDITSWSINHYEELKNIPNFQHIYNSRRNRDKERGKSIIEVLRDMFKNDMFEPIDIATENIMSTIYYDKVDQTVSSLSYDDDCVRPYNVNLEKKMNKKYKIIGLDFECGYIVRDDVEYHTSYIVILIVDGVAMRFDGSDCGKKMVEYILQCVDVEKDETICLMAHNAKYDSNWIMKYLNGISLTMNDGIFIKGAGLLAGKTKEGWKTKRVVIKDLYKLISEPLRNFAGMFGLEQSKEVMPYELYTEENVKKKWVKIEDALTYVKDEDKQQFLDNITKWKLKNGEYYDIIEYSAKYCFIDCDIMMKGYAIYRRWILEALGMDIDHYFTLPSLIDDYLYKEECYDDIYEMSGVPRHFISKCGVGGRVMPANNERSIHEGEISDFDAVSLYPSAMSIIKGYPIGCPKIIPKEGLNYEWLKKQDEYYVEIKVLNVGKHREFPLMCVKNEDGIRDFTNEPKENLFVDRISLEDLIEFQQVEFEVIKGYYFNEGHNNKVNDVITHLFEMRKVKKQEGNKIEKVYKNAMNSAYGKPLMKPIDNEIKFLYGDDEFHVYLERNYNKINSYTKIQDSDIYRVDVSIPINNHFNRVHCGVLIQSQSKHIMNEVMCLAEDIGIKIYYQDTDSMHMSTSDVPVLAKAFKDKYGRDLIGSNMGQFHTDFEMSKTEMKYGVKLVKDSIVSVKNITVGKKTYYNKLRGKTEDGRVFYEDQFRTKGVSHSSIEHTAKEEKISIEDIFMELYNGTKKEFDLCEGGKKKKFKFNKNMSVNYISSFKRVLEFKKSPRLNK